MNFLVGDIGGTNTRLGLAEGKSGKLIFKLNFTNSKYEDLTAIVEEFLEKLKEFTTNCQPQNACFAVAGPVDKKQNSCPLTNLGWTLNGDYLATLLRIEKVVLINDFEAVGYGVLQELRVLQELGKSESFKTLQEVREKNQSSRESLPSPIGVIGAGTGLGEAFILKSPEDKEIVYPTEGGHVDFAARFLEEFQLLEDIKKRYSLSRVSVERVVSGPGIVAIYQFLRDRHQFDEPKEIAKEVKDWEDLGSELSKAPAEAIARESKTDPLCKEVIRIFRDAYSSEVGNFALKILPYRGLYIAGGIAPSILENSDLERLFLENLKNKGRMKKVIEKIPIYLVKNPKIGLIGATYYSQHHLI